MTTGQRCHVRVSLRTETVTYDGPDIPSPEGSPHVGPRTGAMLTRDWWECDSNCGTRFSPLSRAASCPPSETEND
jgi:hypothetical protein